MKTTRSLRCAIYTRKSTEEGVDQVFNSLDAQREACEAYVRSQIGEGWRTIPTAYDDGGYSGGNMERPGLQALLKDIESGRVDIVVVYKVDRLTRSLADFAKIVERFDKRGVSFVSVTQAFNTTTSMGRLTLNVLLSFAQFEREVTSERIRDKIAASKKKGMWMGGMPPFGYVVREKKIYPDPKEAPIVRCIFQRYLDLGSVLPLKAELAGEGVRSKSRVSRHGKTYGGAVFGRGALYHLLQNRLYVGEVRHKDQRYEGEHEGIVPIDLFEAVQAKLQEQQRRSGASPAARRSHPLAGLIWDEAGRRMSPTHGQKGGRRYRYYASRANSAADALRIPAEPIEQLVFDRVRLIADLPPASTTDTLFQLLKRVEIGPEALRLSLDAGVLTDHLRGAPELHHHTADTVTRLQQRLGDGEALVEQGGFVVLNVPVRPIRRGGLTALVHPGHGKPVGPAKPDPALLKAIARAHGWLDQMVSGQASTFRDVAKAEGIEERYVRRLIPLAFLPPAMLTDALTGWQTLDLTVDRVATRGIPLEW
ncbi:MAG: recombinase family protein [Micropepsaceae bacterium]